MALGSARLASRWTVVSLLVLAAPPPAVAADDAASSVESAEPVQDPAPAAAEAAAAAADDDDDLRERITEREDRRRPVEPWSIDVAGRPLVLEGEYEIQLESVRPRIFGPGVEQPDRLLLEQGLQLEVFYSFGPPLSLFAQTQAVMEKDLLAHTPDALSDLFVERGEMWLYSENIAGSHVNLELGRLNFEDERRWWWDDELDAVRVAYERERFEIALAYARELFPTRSDRDFVEPDDEDVGRLIAEASWDWRPNHGLELFLLHQDDHSHSENPGDIVPADREDESDGRLTWFGVRLLGAFELPAWGILGYWLDTALVRGEERFVEFEALSPGQSEVEGVTHPDVSGWAVDAGVNWVLPTVWEPRLFAGYAFGSGDSHPATGTDHSFRQTGIEANEAGFGGVERYVHYGVLLAPELSNLGIVTAGAGISLWRSSSLDLVYHRYRLAQPATSLRQSRLEFTLSSEARDLGDEIDVVLAIEEWERLELEFTFAAFRAGHAFGTEEGTWSVLGFAALRFAF